MGKAVRVEGTEQRVAPGSLHGGSPGFLHEG